MITFRDICEYLDRIEQETSRNAMVSIYAELLLKCKTEIDEHLDILAYFTSGILQPKFRSIEFNIGDKLIEHAISLAYGYPRKDVEALYQKLGDLGFVAERLCQSRKQMPLCTKVLTLPDIYLSYYNLGRLGGKGSLNSKIKTLADLFGNASTLEARYIARYPTGQMRIGIAESSILEAVSVALTGTKELKEEIERSYNLCSDIGRVVKAWLTQQNEKIDLFWIDYFSPVRPALAERVSSTREIFEHAKECAIEYKYDGMRLQIHKKRDKVVLFSRNQEVVTHMFPDVVEEIKRIQHDFIAECEAVGYDEEKRVLLPFQVMIKRKRKYDVDKFTSIIPVKLYFFDLLKLDDKDVYYMQYKERRYLLEHMLTENYEHLKMSHIAPAKIVSDSKEADEIFRNAIQQGLEGIMAKDIYAVYTPGVRKYAWMKLKKSYGPAIDTIDAVIVGFFYGKGARAEKEYGGVLCAVYNSETGMFETIAKASSGLSEQEMEELKQKFSSLRSEFQPKNIVSEIKPDYWVIPSIVVELAYDEITISDLHTCGRIDKKGYALRFPRIIRIRDDKSLDDCTTTQEILSIYEKARLNKPNK